MNDTRYKKLGIVRGGQYAKRETRSSVVLKAAADAREKLVALLYGRRKSRMLGCIQGGDTAPLTKPLEFAAELRDARIEYAKALEIVVAPQMKGIAALYGRTFDTGDFPKVA